MSRMGCAASQQSRRLASVVVNPRANGSIDSGWISVTSTSIWEALGSGYLTSHDPTVNSRRARYTAANIVNGAKFSVSFGSQHHERGTFNANIRVGVATSVTLELVGSDALVYASKTTSVSGWHSVAFENVPSGITLSARFTLSGSALNNQNPYVYETYLDTRSRVPFYQARIGSAQQNSSGATTLSGTLSAGAQVGEVVIVAVASSGGTDIIGVSDTSLNTWTEIGEASAGASTRVALYASVVSYAIRAGGSITAHWQSNTFPRFMVVERILGSKSLPPDSSAKGTATASPTTSIGVTGLTCNVPQALSFSVICVASSTAAVNATSPAVLLTGLAGGSRQERTAYRQVGEWLDQEEITFTISSSQQAAVVAGVFPYG
jgi:hypothetical protein